MTFKKFVLDTIGAFSPKTAFKLAYFSKRRRFPNVSNPSDISEILISQVLRGDINKYSYLADKYVVRDFVKSKGLESILVPLIGVYSSENEITFDTLPNKFAIKANWGAGMNIVCRDKGKLDEGYCKAQVKRWLASSDYSYTEPHYSLIEKRIVCEEFIDDGTGGLPIDYKFLCIHGKVHCILACSDRSNTHAEYLPYSLHWEPLYDYYTEISSNAKLIEKPKNFDRMISVAETLSANLGFVRIDLYTNGERIWFGEITLTPAGCIFHRWSQSALDKMGEVYLRKV